MEGKKYYFDVLRLLATFAVVVMHTSSAFGNLENSLSEADVFSYSMYHDITTFAVPVFVMISGALFLSPERDTSYPILISKYVRRIVLALIIFGLPMCLLETFFSHESMAKAFLNLLLGRSWTHMWYLYMLICLYLLTPMLKAFLQTESRRTVEFVLLVLFVLSSVLPMLVSYGVPIESWMIINKPFILYYILGYYLLSIEQLPVSRIVCFALFLVLPATVLVSLLGFFPAHEVLYADSFVVIGASALFLLFKRMNVRWSTATSCYPYCFAIYLVHPFFINVACKFFHFDITTFAPAWASVPLAAMVIFSLSFAVSWALRRIPFMRKVI